MGKVAKSRRPPRNQGQFRGWNPNAWARGSKWYQMGLPQFMLIALGLSLGGLAGAMGLGWLDRPVDPSGFTCGSVSVLDGDTFTCDGKRIRMAGIDAPELPGHCRTGRDCAPGDPYDST